MTLDDLIPGAGSNSYKVTTGPGFTLIISPLMPNSSKIVSNDPAFFSKIS